MKKIFAAVLAALMIVSLLPVTALAADDAVYELVTDASTLAAGDKVIIVAANSTVAMSTTQNGNNRGQTTITKSGNTITNPDTSVQVVTLETGKVSGTFAFNVGTAGYLTSASSSKNYLRSSTTLNENSSWKIEIASATGVATIKSQGTYTKNWMRQNSSSSIFSCYSTGQNDISLYRLVVATGDCGGNHTEEVIPAVDATCSTTGLTAGVKCSVCGEILTKQETVPTVPHTYVDGVCEVCGAIEEPEADSELTIAEALALGAKYTKDSYTTGKFYVSGEITEVYNTTYGNMYIKDEEGNTLTVYGTYSADGSTRYDAMETKPIAGDKVTVYGVIGKYNDPQMKEAWITAHEQTGCKHETTEAIGEAKEPTCTETGMTAGAKCTVCGAVVEAQTEIPKAAHDYVEGKCSVCGAEEPNIVEATLTFDDAAKRTSTGTEAHVWEENGIKVTNTKTSSSNALVENVAPVRFYKNSEVTIEYPGMVKLAFVCNTGAYAEDMAATISAEVGAATVDGKVATVELNQAVDTITIVLSVGQIRLDAIVVTAEKANAEHQHTEETVPGYAATCTEPGLTDGVKCAECGEILTAQETIDALGHKWGERVFDAEKKAFVTDCANCDEQIVEEATEGAIVTSPASVNVLVRDTVEFKVETTGDIASYKWQYSKDNGKSWYTSTLSTTDTVSLTAYTDVNGRQMRCIVVDVFGNELVSDAATINIDVLKITENPKDVECYNRQAVTMSVEVSYSGTYTYQWQYSQNGTTWYNSTLEGNKTETLRFTAYSDIDGRQFRCAIKDQKGGLTYSQPGKLTVKKMDYEKVATVNAKAYEATSITIQVTSGEDVKIQWQYSQNGTTWYNSTLEGNKTETLRFTAYKDINERQFRCVLVDAYGNRVVTDATVLYVE